MMPKQGQKGRAGTDLSEWHNECRPNGIVVHIRIADWDSSELPNETHPNRRMKLIQTAEWIVATKEVNHDLDILRDRPLRPCSQPSWCYGSASRKVRVMPMAGCFKTWAERRRDLIDRIVTW